MKTTSGQTFIETYVNCPYCGCYQNRFEDLREHFDADRPEFEDDEVELRCEDCGEAFIVTDVTY